MLFNASITNNYFLYIFKSTLIIIFNNFMLHVVDLTNVQTKSQINKFEEILT